MTLERTTPDGLVPFVKATVLLVEDGLAVRVLCQRVLAAVGHEVLVAQHGEDALAAAAAFPGHIDLLLTDVALPNLNGRELYERLRETHVRLRVLYMSGYTDDEMARLGIDKDARVLHKPFAVSDLLIAVQAILTSH